MSYRAVLFDMDGVIVDSEPLHVAAFQTTLKEFGHELTEESYKQHFAGRTDEAGFKRYFEFVNESVDLPLIMSKKAQAYLELASDRLVPYTGVIACICDLAEREVPLGLVTGSLRAEAEAVLKAFSLTHLFSAVVAAEDITRSKPDPEGYLKGSLALNILPADCIVIEDAPSGVQAAKSAGMRVVGVTNTHDDKELEGAVLILRQLKPGCFDSL